jgi:tRNA U34 2-thiouridine synthase MnmA/TrmU
MGADSRSGDAAPSISSHVFTRFRPSKKREESKQKWETLKDHIYKLYVAEEKTLRETMVEIEEKHGLKARYICLEKDND